LTCNGGRLEIKKGKKIQLNILNICATIGQRKTSTRGKYAASATRNNFRITTGKKSTTNDLRAKRILFVQQIEIGRDERMEKKKQKL
jgi:hypothetical protein